MPRISQITTEAPNSTSDLIGDIGSTTRRFNVNQLPGTITTAGTSGQVLQTSAGAAIWVNSTTIPGALPSTVGTSGQVLKTTGGVAAWTNRPNPAVKLWADVGISSNVFTSGAFQSLAFGAKDFDTDLLGTTASTSAPITIRTLGVYVVHGTVQMNAASERFLVALAKGTTIVSEALVPTSTALLSRQSVAHVMSIDRHTSTGAIYTLNVAVGSTVLGISSGMRMASLEAAWISS